MCGTVALWVTDVYSRRTDATEPKSIKLDTPVSRVLYAQLSEDRTVVVSALAKKYGGLILVKIEATLDDSTVGDTLDAAEWVKGLMQAAYGGERGASSLL